MPLTDSIIVNHINIEGNKVTHSNIIYRELAFEQQDTLALTELPQMLEQSKTNLLKTSLFNFVLQIRL
ncbi:MAG: hypothetical protein HC906_02720 [Bacteroidales bacterium]|nr:hypothetical protein [Bacteroidales bacterium]